MPNIKERLDQIIPKIQSEAFIQNKGLGNEIGRCRGASKLG